MMSGKETFQQRYHCLLGVFNKHISRLCHRCQCLDTCSILVGYLFGCSKFIRQHFIQFSPMAGMTRSSHLFFKTVWLACVWVLWKEMNHRIFKNIASDPSVLIDKVKFHSFLWLKSHQVSFTYSYYDWWKHPLLCMGVHM